MQTTALVVREANGPFALESLTLEAPRPDEVLVEVRATGICHTDLSARSQDLPTPLPAVLGHEGAGIVRAVGSQVRSVVAGDHVVMAGLFCGECRMCGSGRPSYCEDSVSRILSGVRGDATGPLTDVDGAVVHTFFHGSFGAHAVVPSRLVVKISPELPFELVAPLGCGVMTGAGTILNELRPEKGSTIAVFGAGGVGLSAVAAALVAECSTIIAVDTKSSRLDLARELGATATVDASEVDSVEAIVELSGGGVDYSVEASGVAVCGPQSVKVLRTQGVAALVGAAGWDTQLAVDWSPFIGMGRQLRGVAMGSSDPHTFIPRLIELWQEGRLPFDKIITEFPLADFDLALRAMERGDVVKPVIRFP